MRRCSTIFGGRVLNKTNYQGGGAVGTDVPTTGGDTRSANILHGEGSCCGGLGTAFLSGYYAGMYVSEYLKSI